MEFESLLGNAKWDILSELTTGPKAASELAKRAGTSLANISQQGRLLEAWGLVKLKPEVKEGPGKPRRIYSLHKELAHIAMLHQGFAGKKAIILDSFHTAILNIWFLPKPEDHYFLQKYFWQNEDIIASCDAMAVVDSTPAELHLLIVAPVDKLEKLRKEFSKVEVKSPETKKTIIAWTHSADELAEGLERGEDYFKNLIKNAHVIMDAGGALAPFLR